MVNACLVDFYSANEYKSLGCYKYKPNMGMTVLEGEDPDVDDGDYKLRTNVYLTSGTEGMLRKNFEYMCTTIPEFFFPSKETNYNELPVYVKYGNNVKDLPVTV